jgi:uncharacterized membrane protein
LLIENQGVVVAAPTVVSYRGSLHPLHAVFLSFPLPLFAGALLSDMAYVSSFHVQWINFAQWLLAGGLLVGAFALVWAVVGMLRSEPASTRRRAVYLIALLAMWVLGFINSLIHAKDAFASMPAGLYLSAIVTLLALIAAWTGYSGLHATEVK